MTDYKDFLPYILPEVPGCPNPTVIRSIRDTIREFCHKTWLWTEVVEYELEKDSSIIFVDMPRQSSIISLLYFVESNMKVEIEDNFIIREKRNGVESEFSQIETEKGELRAAFKPSRISTSSPDFIYNDHIEAISFGTKARLLINAQKQWANPQLAIGYNQLFNKKIVEEKIRLVKGYTKRSLKVKPRRFI